MKVLSWNILMYSEKKQDLITKAEYIAEEIARINPDILMLQEASEYFIEILLSRCSYIRYPDVLTHGGLCIIFAKPEVNVSNTFVFFNTGVGVEVDKKKFVTCHLVPGVKNQTFRQGQLKEIVNSTGQDKCLIMGDMNMNKYQHFDNNKMKDVAVTVNNLLDTWFLSYFIKDNKTSRRYDRVYTDMKTENYTVYDGYKHLSDHLPISVEIF